LVTEAVGCEQLA